MSTRAGRVPPVSVGEAGGGLGTGRVGPEASRGCGVDIAGKRAAAGGAREAPWGTGGAAGAGDWLGGVVPGAGWVQPVAGEGPKEGSSAGCVGPDSTASWEGSVVAAAGGTGARAVPGCARGVLGRGYGPGCPASASRGGRGGRVRGRAAAGGPGGGAARGRRVARLCWPTSRCARLRLWPACAMAS